MSEIEIIEELKKKLEDHEKRIVKLENSFFKGVGSERIDKKISIREYLISKKPKNDVNKTLAIGNYLEKYENLEFFNKND